MPRDKQDADVANGELRLDFFLPVNSGRHVLVGPELNDAVGCRREIAQDFGEPMDVAFGRALRLVRKSPPKMIQARKVQGQYMAAVRGLKPADCNRVKKLTSEKGAVAGLALARSLWQGPKSLRKAGSAIPVVKSSGNVSPRHHSPEIIR